MKVFRVLELCFISIVSIFILSACSDDTNNNDNVEEEIIIEPLGNSVVFFRQGMNFTAGAGSEVLEFSCNGAWTLDVANTTGGSTWCSVSSRSGKAGENAVTVAVTANAGYEDRSVTLTLRAGMAMQIIVVTQKQQDAILLTSDKFELDNKGGTIEVEVKANIDYEMEIAEDAQGWINEVSTRSLSSRVFVFDISANEDYDKREGEIYFRSGNKAETVHVYQSGGGIILLSQNEYIASDEGETITVELKSNCEFETIMPNVDWLTDAPDTKAMSSHTLYYVISPNETYDSREAKIVFVDKNNPQVTDTLTVIQLQKDALILSKDTYEIGPDGGSFDVELKTNVEYSVNISEEHSWIKQVDTKALSENSLHFTVNKLDVNQERTGLINIKGSNNLESTVTVVQKKRDMSILNIYVEEAGTLEDLIGTENKYDVEELTISGNITGTDIGLIRDMAGNKGSLKILDLTDATIHGGSYYSTPYSGLIESKDNIITRSMFSGYLYKLVSVKLPKNIISIESDAFNGSRITSILIPKSVKEIGSSAFRSSNVESVKIERGGNLRIEEGAFEYCRNLTSIDFGDGVTFLGYQAFSGCRNLTKIVFPKSVKSIESRPYGSEVFDSYLKEIIFEEGVDTIFNAFRGLENLESVVIPNTVKVIKDGAFRVCGLYSLKLPDSIEEIGKRAFASTKLREITLGSGLKNIGDRAFYGSHINEMHCKSIVPPKLGKECFETINAGQYVTVYVPKGSKEAYMNSWLSSFYYGDIFEEFIEEE